MRLEINYPIFIGCIMGCFLIGAVSKTALSRKRHKIVFALMMALTLPAFLPGHGEFVMLLPNAALFAVSSSTAISVAVLFTLVNFLLAWFFLGKIDNYFTEKQ